MPEGSEPDHLTSANQPGPRRVHPSLQGPGSLRPYNVYRPHSALQGRTALEVIQQWKAA